MSIDVEPAPLVKRGVVVIDHLIATLAGSIIALPVFFLLPGTIQGPSSILFLLYLLLFTIGYFTFFEARTGTTPMKRVVDLHVVDRSGSPPTWKQALVRNLARLIDIAPSIYLVGAGCILASNVRQRLGDRLAGTVVIETETAGDRYNIKPGRANTKMKVIGYSLAGLGVLPLFGLVFRLLTILL